MVKEINKEKWISIIEKQNSSGITQEKWCKQNNIKFHQFKYYKKKLKRKDTVSQTNFIKIKPSTDEVDEMKKQTNEKHNSLSLLIGKIEINIHNQQDIRLLDDVLKVVLKYAE